MNENNETNVDQTISSQFLNKRGKTYIVNNGEPALVFHFTLRKVGVLAAPDGIKLVYNMTSENARTNELTSRKVALASKDFQSRKRLWDILEEKLSKIFVIFIEHNASPQILSDYYHHLKEEGRLLSTKQYKCAEFVGFHRDTWVVSNEVQIKNGIIVPSMDIEYIMDGGAEKCSLDVNEQLFSDKEYFDSVFQRVISETLHFKENRLACLHAMAFMITKLLSIQEAGDNLPASQSKFAALSSTEKSVGKTTMQQILSRGVGIGHNHPSMIAGGDGLMSGTSSRKQLEFLGQTNMFVMINELKVSSQHIGHNLNQAHDGFSCGSISRGSFTPRACILASTNDTRPHERLDGRMLMIPCVGGESFTPADKKKIEDDFMTLANYNKGFLIAWSCHYRRKMAHIFHEHLHSLITEIQKLDPFIQSRLVSCLASNILTLFLIINNASLDIDPSYIFQSIVNVNQDTTWDVVNTSMWREIGDAIQEDEEVATWFNPQTTFRDCNGKDIKCVAIRVPKLQSLPDINYNDIKSRVISKYGNKAYNVNALFCLDKTSSLADLKNKDMCSSMRCCKFPWRIIPDEIATEIAEACGIEGMVEEPAELDETKVAQIFEALQRGAPIVQANCSQMVDSDLELTPRSAAKYHSYSPKRKGAFREGAIAYKRLFEEFSEDSEDSE